MKIIKQNFSQDFIEAVSNTMKETIFGSNEIIIKPRDEGNMLL